MDFLFSPAFTRALKKKPESVQKSAEEAVKLLWQVVHKKIHTPPKGLGLKHLAQNKWEIRAGIHERIFFELSSSEVVFIFIGNHDDVRRLLKNE